MSYTSKSKTLTRAATNADHLRKSLQSDDPVSQVEAIDRMLEHPEFVGATRRDVLAERESIPLKQFRHVLALEHGFDSWEEFKKVVEDLPEQTYDVRIYHAGDWDRICTFGIEAPTPEIAQRLGLRRAQADFGPGEFEAEIDDGEPWAVPEILRAPEANRPAPAADEDFALAPGQHFVAYTDDDGERMYEGRLVSKTRSGAMVEAAEVYGDELVEVSIEEPNGDILRVVWDRDSDPVPGDEESRGPDVAAAAAGLESGRREAYESLYQEYEFAGKVADSDGAYARGRAMWRTVYLEVEGIESSVPVTYTVIFRPGSIEVETERVGPGYARENEPSRQEVIG